MTDKQKAVMKIESALLVLNKVCTEAKKLDVFPVAIVGNIGNYEMIYKQNLKDSHSDRISNILACE